MTFKSKLRRIGNSVGVIIPRDVITLYRLGDEIELEVITKQGELGYNESKVITENGTPVITKKVFNNM